MAADTASNSWGEGAWEGLPKTKNKQRGEGKTEYDTKKLGTFSLLFPGEEGKFLVT